jgi:hypothetical protein
MRGEERKGIKEKSRLGRWGGKRIGKGQRR